MIDPVDEHVEIVARIGNGLPIPTWSALARAIDAALTELGYTDVVIIGDGTGRIAARRPGAPPRAPAVKAPA